MKRTLIAIAAALALIAPAVVASPAQASSLSFTFNASPEPVKKGGYVTLSGKTTGLGSGAIYAEVDFYFKAAGSTKWVFQNYTRPRSNGTYSRRQAQNHSGTWRADIWWDGEDYKGPSRTDYVAASGTQLPGVPRYYGDYYVVFGPTWFNPSGDGSWYFTNIHWTSRGTTSGRATATEHMNDCIPYCAAGHFHTRSTVLTFSGVTQHHGANMYRKFHSSHSSWINL